MEKKINKHILWGYAVGNMAESCSYMFVTSYLLVYLTTVAKIKPNFAGVIISVTILMEAFISLYIGRKSDNTNNKYGRRRPLMFIASILMPLTTIMLFHNVKFVENIAVLYYLIVGILFRSMYAFYYIPYTALGAELTNDYDDRIILKSISRMFGIFGCLIAFILPLILDEILSKHNISNNVIWNIIASIIGAIIFICGIYSWHNTKGCEVINTNKKLKNNFSIISILISWRELIKLKAMRIALLYKGFCVLGVTIFSGSLVIYIKYRLGLNADISVIIFIASSILALLITPIVAKIAIDIGKENQQKIFLFVAAAICIVIYSINIKSYIVIFLLVLINNIVQNSFWQISYAIFYDIVELDIFVNNVRREGDISCMHSIVGSVFTAIGMQIIGTSIQLSKLDITLISQSEYSLKILDFIFILTPGLMYLISAIVVNKYPINKERFNKIKKNINYDNNKIYS